MAHSGTVQPLPRISGQIIIDELIRNMELGRLELGYSILVPCIFSVYLHPDDYTRVLSVQELIKEDAKRALTARLAEWNAKSGVLRRNAPRKTYRIAHQRLVDRPLCRQRIHRAARRCRDPLGVERYRSARISRHQDDADRSHAFRDAGARGARSREHAHAQRPGIRRNSLPG